MKLFAGLSTTDYQDILRAIGHVLDEHKLADIRLWEHENGMILQGRKHGDREGGAYETFLLTDDDLHDLLDASYQRRGLASSRYVIGD